MRNWLIEIFGPPKPVGTGRVLTSPSRLSREKATKVCEEFPLDSVLRDLGAVAARELATALEGLNLRPADYADQDFQKVLAKRIADAVKSNPDAFAKAVTEQLKLRG